MTNIEEVLNRSDFALAVAALDEDTEKLILDLAEALRRESTSWRCFHCGETFTTSGSAQDHFGETPESVVGCLIDRVALEEGGEPERGRGLLMALRKVEKERDQLRAENDKLKNG